LVSPSHFIINSPFPEVGKTITRQMRSQRVVKRLSFSRICTEHYWITINPGNKITPAATGVKLREAISSGQNISPSCI